MVSLWQDIVQEFPQAIIATGRWFLLNSGFDVQIPDSRRIRNGHHEEIEAFIENRPEVL